MPTPLRTPAAAPHLGAAITVEYAAVACPLFSPFQQSPSGVPGTRILQRIPVYQLHIQRVWPGTKCWNSGGRSRAAYLNWFYSPGGRRDEVGGIGSSTGGANCTGSFPYFDYTDDKRSNKLIKVPADSEDAAQKIADLFEKQDFSALALYEKYIDQPVSLRS